MADCSNVFKTAIWISYSNNQAILMLCNLRPPFINSIIGNRHSLCTLNGKSVT